MRRIYLIMMVLVLVVISTSALKSDVNVKEKEDEIKSLRTEVQLLNERYRVSLAAMERRLQYLESFHPKLTNLPPSGLGNRESAQRPGRLYSSPYISPENLYHPENRIQRLYNRRYGKDE